MCWWCVEDSSEIWTFRSAGKLLKTESGQLKKLQEVHETKLIHSLIVYEQKDYCILLPEKLIYLEESGTSQVAWKKGIATELFRRYKDLEDAQVTLATWKGYSSPLRCLQVMHCVPVSMGCHHARLGFDGIVVFESFLNL